uniref:Protein TMEM155 n=2 Tax=Equus TaxID=9789 RepID=A0A8C4MHP4_EQUAS
MGTAVDAGLMPSGAIPQNKRENLPRVCHVLAFLGMTRCQDLFLVHLQGWELGSRWESCFPIGNQDGLLSRSCRTEWWLKQSRGFVLFLCDKEVGGRLLLVLVQQLTGIRVKVAPPELPLAFPSGSKTVASTPHKKMEEAQRENRACQCESTSFKELSQQPNNFCLHLIGQTVSLATAMRNVIFVAGHITAFN